MVDSPPYSKDTDDEQCDVERGDENTQYADIGGRVDGMGSER